jgi:hypothetical protein
MLEAKWKTLKASNLKRIVGKARKAKTSRRILKKSTRRRRYRRKQRGGDGDTVPFGDSDGVPKGLGGTVTGMSEEGVPLTRSMQTGGDDDDENDNNA